MGKNIPSDHFAYYGLNTAVVAATTVFYVFVGASVKYYYSCYGRVFVNDFRCGQNLSQVSK